MAGITLKYRNGLLPENIAQILEDADKQDLEVLPQEIIDRFYPMVGDDSFRDYHIAYYGEIVNAYLIEQEG